MTSKLITDLFRAEYQRHQDDHANTAACCSGCRIASNIPILADQVDAIEAQLAAAQTAITAMREAFATIRDRAFGLGGNPTTPFAPDVIAEIHKLASDHAIPNNGYPTDTNAGVA